MTLARLAPLLLGLAFSAPCSAAGGRELVAALRGVLQEDHVDVRDAVWIIETSGLKVDDVVGGLARVLPGLPAASAVEAEYMLGRIGPRAAPAAPALLERLVASRDLDVRYEAVRALGRVGTAATPAVPAIAAAAGEADSDMRTAVAEALGRIDPAGALSAATLGRLCGDAEEAVRAACARASRPLRDR
ncbi:MAG TPA: HEAT repeat domain-containing protein [Elusimicrobiota bacterium]|nr:HEAT repeat domain-containing protein [Elusimicrobiota bacterium]